MKGNDGAGSGLGGSGRIGQEIVAGLARCGASVTVADLRPPAEAGAFVRCEVTDEAAVRQTLEDSDLVVHAVGPYYRYGDRVAAALAAGVPYLDVCDDADVTEAILALHDAARDAGTPVVTGAGFSPGIVNAVALCLAGRYDEVEATGDLSRDELRAWCAAHLTDAKTVDEVYLVEYIPLTPIGKPDRHRLAGLLGTEQDTWT
ncbi:saccharopine dehydrogenase NADP-binding domain-containing protein [Nonomuraea sp. 3N208]|uniref:saccharopine dehydrogenase NADP-binding domain-containing protein n=1 Tax=Nonomuraea sp. 3N208 TaxID=3457421 RepID=UPI003FD15EE2